MNAAAKSGLTQRSMTAPIMLQLIGRVCKPPINPIRFTSGSVLGIIRFKVMIVAAL